LFPARPALPFCFAPGGKFQFSSLVIGSLLKPELAELIRQRSFNQLREILCEFPAPDIAEIFTDLRPDDEAVLLRILPRNLAAEVFEHLSVEDQEKLLQALGTEQVAQILNDLAPDDRTALLEELPSAATQKLLSQLSPAERKIATDLLGYPKSSIGRRMTPEYVAIKQNWNAGEVLEHLRREPDKRNSINQLYVVDDQGRLVDYVRLRNLVVADPKTPVVELLENQNLALRATDDQETAIAAFKKYDVTMLPVADSNDVLVGVITVDDVLDLAEKEATEDIQKLGGMEALDAPYLKIGLFSMIQKRAGWLAVLFVGEMFTATAMGYFEDEIAKAVVLALFVPLIISSGGNSGSQATSLIIRALAVRDISLGDWWRVMKRELIAGFALGCVLASIALARILLWPHKEQVYGPHYLLVAATVACSLVGVVLFGSVAGSMLPFILRRLGFDPAAASAPFVATLVDVTGLVIYFSIAYQILHGTLL
jgi:magnesium transporter